MRSRAVAASSPAAAAPMVVVVAVAAPVSVAAAVPTPVRSASRKPSTTMQLVMARRDSAAPWSQSASASETP